MPSEYGAIGIDEIIGALDEIVGEDDDDDDDDYIGEDDDDDDDDDYIGEDDDDDDIDEALAEIVSGEDDDDDDDYDEIGRRRRRRRRPRRRRRIRARRRRPSSRARRAAKIAKRLKRARAVDPRAVMVRRQKRNRRRRLIVPITVTNIAAGGAAEVTIQPQRLFKTRRMIFPSAVADNFRLTDIKVGQQSQFAASGDVPAGCFSEVTVDGYVDFDTADIGNLISFDVQNVGVAAADFQGVLLGPTVY